MSIQDLTPRLTKTAFCVLYGSLSMLQLLSAQCDYSKTEPATADGICNNDPWVLVFEDNFDGKKLDLSEWRIQEHAQGALKGASNQEYNTLDNIRLSGGLLYIDTKEEEVERMAVGWHPPEKVLEDGLPNLRTYNFTSSIIWTKQKYHYGKFEIRCRLPRAKGCWPAFWTFGGDHWNEIDVFEFWDYYGVGGKFKLDKSLRRHRTNAHYDFDKDGGHHNCPKHKYITDFSDGMHTFSLIWTPFIIEWFVDGESVRRKYKYARRMGLKKVTCENFKVGKNYKVDKAFPEEPMHIIVNVGVRRKGIKPGDPETSFPAMMVVDYIRYSKRK